MNKEENNKYTKIRKLIEMKIATMLNYFGDEEHILERFLSIDVPFNKLHYIHIYAYTHTHTHSSQQQQQNN